MTRRRLVVETTADQGLSQCHVQAEGFAFAELAKSSNGEAVIDRSFANLAVRAIRCAHGMSEIPGEEEVFRLEGSPQQIALCEPNCAYQRRAEQLATKSARQMVDIEANEEEIWRLRTRVEAWEAETSLVELEKVFGAVTRDFLDGCGGGDSGEERLRGLVREAVHHWYQETLERARGARGGE